jgi:tripartite-type tricarboxylate transporter receptor subunit TctC
MKKSFIVFVSMFLSILLIATGCSSQQQTSGQTASTEKKAADTYPDKPIEIIVPFAPGGGTDAVGRALAESLKKTLKQDAVVVNKTGGSGAVGMQEGLSAQPDGYKLTVVTREVTSLPILKLAPFKTLDFKFVGSVNKDPGVLVVSGKSKYKTLEDFLAALKESNGKMKFAASAVPNYYGIQLSQEAKSDFITVPFQGAAPAIIEILGGRADFGLYNPGEIKAQLESGDLRALAVMSDERFSGLKDVPTFKEKGLDIVSETYRGIAVPKATPDNVVKVLEDAIAKAKEDPAFTDFMEKSFLGQEYLNSQEFTALIEKDMKLLGPLLESIKK